MKHALLISIALLVLLFFPAFGQHVNWNAAPKTGFVFQITNQEAEKLLTKSNPDTIIHSMLHTQVDTFNVKNGWTARPEKGHFILVSIVENKLHCEYTSVFPYQVLLLREYNALSLQVLDLEGNVREDAKVKFRTRRVRFDREIKTYRIENEWVNASSKTVTVELDGFRSVFNVEKHEVASWANDYHHYDDGPDFYSYMITDKNKYKPGEQVRFKSYALSGSRQPIRRELEVWLMRVGKPIRVGVVSPHRPGSFAGEVHLHDSLKLVLDQYYTLQLRHRNERVVANCTFKYEDYELHGNKLQVELESARHFHPSSNFVTITATSDNGLILKDAKATVVILTENIREIFDAVVSLSDTLMVKEIQLNATEATSVEIPASLFKKSNTTYYVHVGVGNSENRRMEKTVYASHYYSQYEVSATFSNDSILYQLLENGLAMRNVPVRVFRNEETDGVDVSLPYVEKINPAISTIRIQGEHVSRTIRMSDMLPKIEFIGGIENDSFNISISNPQKIQLSWYVYHGSSLLEKGFGQEVEFKSKIEDRTQTYYAELLYSFGGSDHLVSKEFPFRHASLDISLDLPDRVYPGQMVNATIEVNDEEGNPVSGVDLTAVATTAKLNYHLPDLPYFGSTSYSRPDKATYTKRDVNRRTAILELDYNVWAPRARLDTMKYYQFTYPGKKAFFHQVVITDSTQFATYVMKNGVAKEVYVIEVDRKPVYYSWIDQPRAYSFYVQPEETKEVTLRLYDRVLIFDSLCFERGKKTILSVDLDNLPESVQVHNIAPEVAKVRKRRKDKKSVFTPREISRLNQYLAAFTGTASPAYLISVQGFVPVSPGESTGNKLVVGPIFPGIQTYTELGEIETTYKHQGGFSYSFEDNVVYKMDPPELFPNELADKSFRPITNANDVVINQKLFLERRPEDRGRWHPRIIDLVDHACRLKLLLPLEDAKSGVMSVLFQDCRTNDVVSPCKAFTSTSDYFTVPRGLHHIIVLYNNGTYLKMDSVVLQSYRSVVVDMTYEYLRAADSLSGLWSSLKGNCFQSVTAPSRTFDFILSNNRVGNVQGTVFDDLNTPLPGATVVVKGTTVGAVTDINGRFTIDVPSDHSTIVVSFIGFATKEIEVGVGSEVSIVMEADVTALQEVVVVGYGESTRHLLSGSIAIRGAASLTGRVAGLALSQEDYEPGPEREEQHRVQTDREAEQELYEELLALQHLRSQFSDVGLWEPRLFTDRQGKSTFAVKFPDDITRWDAVVYGMNRHLQTGTARKSIRSYKPIMAELHVPQFLIVGDTAHFLGKVLNYTADKTIEGKTTWAGPETFEKDLRFEDYHTDKRAVVVTSSDTITTSYAFTRDDGYFDGEERKVPVFEPGALIADGTLSVLDNTTEIHLQAKKGEVVKVEIIDNPLDVFAGDVRHLLHYRYDCNEQLASKLIGLLNYKLLMEYEGKSFRHDRDVNKIIQRLLKNQNEEFLWSWWDVSPNTSYWMSAHILRALKAAKDAGYTVNLDLENVVRKATYKYDLLDDISLSDVHIIHALAMWDAKVDYQKYVNMLDKHILHHDSIGKVNQQRYRYAQYSLLNEKLLVLEVRQLQQLAFVRDSLLQYRKQTALNEIYFSDGRRARYWHAGELSGNSIAYRIVGRDSTLRDLIIPMQMYFLSLRRKGGWNTYEASNVLMSILPDLVEQGSTKKTPSVVLLSGKVNARIQEFPYNIELSEGEQMYIRKEAGLPLYYMQYVEKRVTAARSGTDAFTIATSFNEKLLTAGQPAVLKATVEVRKDAALEHVMIEIPIPGGCSYSDKRQFDNAIETHREYFKDRTVIFCENMTAGTYVFQLQLLPRFTGKYHVNPAQISLMYFPVISVNNAVEKVEIGE